ncbi:MAG: FHA domain-containing protein [Gemmatimonadetes bacterium]|nr:FHA domain-containing protein [Gemmatimonadota bacterium]
MAYALVSPAGDRRFPLHAGATLIVGREPTCDVPLIDAAVSRRHAELRLDADGGLHLHDLDSRNGTWVNGARIINAVAHDGDTIDFGTVSLTFVTEHTRVAHPTPAMAGLDGGATLLLERAVPSTADAMAALTTSEPQATARLAMLVQVAERLASYPALDALLDGVAVTLRETFDADRAAVLVRGDDGVLSTRAQQLRADAAIAHGVAAPPVPRRIVEGVAERQVALLTNEAASDPRSTGESVIAQSVRAAMAVPLLGAPRMPSTATAHDAPAPRETLGVLYVDHLGHRGGFVEGDLSLLVAFAAIAAAAVERERQVEALQVATRLRERLERYFTPHVASRFARESAAGTSPATLTGLRQPVVVLFSDLRGFTAIAETLPPTALARQLNEYFGAMVECVFRHDGALDKFIGDAVMAWWGSPSWRGDEADRAVAAARDMLTALDTLNARWRIEGRPTFEVGIGVHTGDAFVGDIGSPRRLDHTLIGETVNTASRLCSAARGGEILVSDAIRVALSAAPSAEARPDVQAGRDAPFAWSLTPP